MSTIKILILIPVGIYLFVVGWASNSIGIALILFVLYQTLITLLTKFNVMYTPFKEATPSLIQWIANNINAETSDIDGDVKNILANGLYFSIYFALLSLFCIVVFEESNGLYSFNVSFLASLLQDLFLFGVVGFGWALYNRKRPAEEAPEKRIGYLLNSEGVNEDVRDDIFKQISGHLTYCRKMVFEFRFVEYSADINAFRVEVVSRKQYLNTIRDRVIQDRNHEFQLKTDQIKFPEGFDESYDYNGEICGISIYHGDGRLPEHKVISPIRVDSEETKSYPIEIPGGERFFTEFRFWVWHAVGESYHWTLDRYTNSARLTLKNLTDQPISIATGAEKFIVIGEGVDRKNNNVLIVPPNKEITYSGEEVESGRYLLYTLES